ncbi:MAG: lipid A export permease/ATP-binding protein MsbA [Gammaproteobacteria bacterium]
MLKIFKQPQYSTANSWPIYKRLLGYVKKYWFIFIVAIVASALYSAIDAGLVRLIQPLLDDGFVNRDAKVIALIPIMLSLFLFGRGVMSFLSHYSLNWLARKVVFDIRQQLFEHLLKLPASYYDHHPASEILSKLTYNTEQIAQACTEAIIDSVRNFFLIVFLLGVMLSISWHLTLWFLLLAPIVALLVTGANKLFRRYSHKIQTTVADITHVAQENLLGYKVVRIFGAQQAERDRFIAVSENNRVQEMKLSLTRSISVPLVQFVAGLGVALTLYIATHQSAAYALTAGGFATMVGAMIALLKPVKEITSVSHKIQQGIAGGQSIFAVLDEPTEPEGGEKLTQALTGKVAFKNVSFAYDTGQEVSALSDISFTAKRGEVVALVGHSGSGKTTLVELLARLYDQYTGQILYDDMDIKNIKLDDLRRNLAIVSQHVVLFNDTVAHNVAHGDKDYDEARVVESLKHANALTFVNELPQGIHTLVGQDGQLLSGGQRQRLAIARALYKNAPILIFDEATSALDTASERHIQEAMQGLMQNRTTFVVAHRLSTIENADKIIVLDKGRLMEEGTHTELLAKNGLYARLYQLQFKQDDNV